MWSSMASQFLEGLLLPWPQSSSRVCSFHGLRPSEFLEGLHGHGLSLRVGPSKRRIHEMICRSEPCLKLTGSFIFRPLHSETSGGPRLNCKMGRLICPDGFDPGQGSVRDINEAIKEEFSTLGKLVDEFQEGDRQYRRSMGLLPPLLPPQYSADPDPCYSKLQCERAMERMGPRREWILDSIKRVLDMGGNPFLFPPDLAYEVSAIIGQPRPRPFSTIQPAPRLPPGPGQPAPRPH